MAFSGHFSAMEWRDELAVGHPVIDAQHRDFIEQARRVTGLIAGNSPAGELLPHIKAIVTAAAHHFTTEERILRDHGMADDDDHRRDHTAIVRQLADMVAGLSAQSSSEEMMTVVRTAVVILLEHMLLGDGRLRRHFQGAATA